MFKRYRSRYLRNSAIALVFLGGVLGSLFGGHHHGRTESLYHKLSTCLQYEKGTDTIKPLIYTRDQQRLTEVNEISVGSNAAPDELSLKLAEPRNSTLGFQKIYILSMPTRKDKRDALTISAYLSDIEIEFVDGINGSHISPKSYPENWDYSEPLGSIGCWRGHMDILQRMVRERISSALIMEDDVDWDVMIKAQFLELARGTRHLTKAQGITHSPYGDDWDVISTGHCGAWNRLDEDQEYWVVENDPTVVSESERGWWRKPDLSPRALSGNHTRLVFTPSRYSCTASYAISLKGALRFLHDQSVLPNGQAVDMGFAAFCKKHEYGNASCLATYPMITGVHKAAGDASRDSDRKTSNLSKAKIRKTSRSDHLVFPVRLNLGVLLQGGTIIKAQSTSDSALLKRIDLSKFSLPTGAGILVRKEEYKQYGDMQKVSKKSIENVEKP